MEQSVATVNGKTVTVKKWVAILSIIIMFISIAGTIFGAVVDPLIWKQGIETSVRDNSERVDKIEIWQEQHAKDTIIQNNLNQRQVHELQLNLKAFMQANGLKYQVITE